MDKVRDIVGLYMSPPENALVLAVDVVLHFTPTSASWLNLVERWFAELTRRKLQRSTHRCVVELERDIVAWTQNWNADPKTFVWTKTADQILEALAGYCQRINNSRH